RHQSLTTRQKLILHGLHRQIGGTLLELLLALILALGFYQILCLQFGDRSVAISGYAGRAGRGSRSTSDAGKGCLSRTPIHWSAARRHASRELPELANCHQTQRVGTNGAVGALSEQ